MAALKKMRGSCFNLLPDELIADICARLSAADLVAFASTCNQFHTLALAGTVRFLLAPSPKLLNDCLLLHLSGTLRKGKVCVMENVKEASGQPAGLGDRTGVSFLSKLRDCQQRFFAIGEPPEVSETGQSPRRILGRVAEESSAIPAEYQPGAWQANGSPLGKDILALDLSHIKGLSMLSVRTCKRLKTLVLPPTITHLDAQGCTELERISVSRLADNDGGSYGLPAVQSISIGGCRYLKVDGLIQMLSSSKTFVPLKYLDMTWCFRLSNAAIARTLWKCPNLETLVLRGIAGKQTLTALAAGACASLTSVDLGFSQDVVDEDVEAVVTACTALTRCNLRGCRRVSNGTFNKVPQILLTRMAAKEGRPAGPSFHYLRRNSI